MQSHCRILASIWLWAEMSKQMDFLEKEIGRVSIFFLHCLPFPPIPHATLVNRCKTDAGAVLTCLTIKASEDQEGDGFDVAVHTWNLISFPVSIHLHRSAQTYTSNNIGRGPGSHWRPAGTYHRTTEQKFICPKETSGGSPMGCSSCYIGATALPLGVTVNWAVTQFNRTDYCYGLATKYKCLYIKHVVGVTC